MPSTDYTHHIFCCTNVRPDGAKRGCCASKGSLELRNYMKVRMKELGLKDTTRINTSGCLDMCEYGPVMVIYPENIWYQYKNQEDVERILNEHLLGGEIVEDLRLILAD